MSPQPQEDLTPAIRIVPHVDGPRSLRFDIIERDVPEGVVIKIGRFTDKALVANRVTFKSKVVSRGHAEIWSEGNKFFIKDTKSSSGTFLNHSRLSTPGAESKAFQLNDGDIVQLGVDYQGGTEEIYRCVKMRIELNRSWKRQINSYSINALKDLKQLTGPDAYKQQKNDCCICLSGIGPCQALFLTPCSHLFHFKCIKHEIDKCYPGFICPMCRGSADLDAPIENIIDWESLAEQEDEEKKGVGESTSAKKEQTTKNETQATRPKSTSKLIEDRSKSIEERPNLIGRSPAILSSVTPNSFSVPIPGNKKTSNPSEDSDDPCIILGKTLPSSPPPIPGMSFIDEGTDSGPSSPTNQYREQGETPRLGEIAEEDEGSMSSSSLNPSGRNQIHQTTSFQESSSSSASASDNDDDALLIGLPDSFDIRARSNLSGQSDDSRAKGKGVDRFGMGQKGEDVL